MLLNLLKICAFFGFIHGIVINFQFSKQLERDKKFIEREMKPSVDFVNNFKEKNLKLTSKKEYYTWERTFHNDFSNSIQNDTVIVGLGSLFYIRSEGDVIYEDLDQFKGVNWKTDFAISAWNGDYYEYYYSWRNCYSLGN
jgi:hypothetical protein